MSGDSCTVVSYMENDGIKAIDQCKKMLCIISSIVSKDFSHINNHQLSHLSEISAIRCLLG